MANPDPETEDHNRGQELGAKSTFFDRFMHEGFFRAAATKDFNKGWDHGVAHPPGSSHSSSKSQPLREGDSSPRRDGSSSKEMPS